VSVAPAVLPLPGGSAGTALELHPLRCGDVAMPEGWVHGTAGLRGALGAVGVGSRTLRAPIIAFLLVHPTAGAVLVDTGFSAEAFTDKRRALGRVNDLLFRDARPTPEGTIAEQVAARGYAPREIGLVVMTHLHVDHACGLVDFPGATVLVTEPEWEAAHARGAAFAGYHRPHLDPRLDYRLVPLPSPLATGLDRLAQAHDVFGDGSIRLLPTPGHSAGHQAVIVNLGDRQALIAGDAIYTLDTLRTGERPYRAVSRREFEASLETLVAYDRANPDAVIVPGHDMEAWSALEPRYGGALHTVARDAGRRARGA
jgi:N-acyl homoserine lactone hydrolase